MIYVEVVDLYLKEFPMGQKRTILDLGIYAAMADEVMTDEEKAVVDKICREMEMKIDYKPIYTLENTIYDLEHDFDDSDKLKIFLEIVSIVASDHVTDRELEFIKKLQKELKINDEKYDLAMSIAKDFLRVSGVLEKYFEEEVE